MTLFARTSLIAAALVALTAGAAESSVALPKSSPFMPPGSAAAGVTAANETLEFAGVSVLGKKTDLIFYDKAAKKSHWIAVGETKEGIAVLNYDARREQAVVKVNGAEKVLLLRKGAGPVNTPSPVPAMHTGFNVAAAQPAVVKIQPAPPADVTQLAAPVPAAAPAAPAPAPNTPEGQAKAETEARMLVSDLLEIGMAQRKAYEEAQRKAAEKQPSATEPPKP